MAPRGGNDDASKTGSSFKGEDNFTRPKIGLELPPTQDVTIYKQLG